MADVQPLHESNDQAFFNSLDQDKDGKLSLKDIEAALASGALPQEFAAAFHKDSEGAAAEAQTRSHGRTLVLFDVDGTLAVPGQPADQVTVDMLARLREHYTVGIVGAGTFVQQQGQLGGEGLLKRLDYCFSENGVHAFEGDRLLHSKTLKEHLGQERWAKFETELEAILASSREEAAALLQRASPGASIDTRGTFLEMRQCNINVCVIGRTPTLSKEERCAFEAVDREAGLRERVRQELVRRFGADTEFGLNFAIGGQIGIDCCPVGWDKTFCLRWIDEQLHDVVHFFGDKTEPGGGDHELYVHPRIKGHAVQDAADTREQVERLLLAPGALARDGGHKALAAAEEANSTEQRQS